MPEWGLFKYFSDTYPRVYFSCRRRLYNKAMLYRFELYLRHLPQTQSNTYQNTNQNSNQRANQDSDTQNLLQR